MKSFFAERLSRAQQSSHFRCDGKGGVWPSATIKMPPACPPADDEFDGLPLYIRGEWTQSQPLACQPPRPANNLVSDSFPGAEPAAHCERRQRASLAAQYGQALGRIVERRGTDPTHPLRQSLEAFYRGRWSDVQEELALVLVALHSIDKIAHCFGPKFERALVIMPRNLPLYSLLVFCLVPASQTREVLVHYPKLVQDRALPIIEAFAACIQELPSSRRGASELQRLSRNLFTALARNRDSATAAATITVGRGSQHAERSQQKHPSSSRNPTCAAPPKVNFPGFGPIVLDVNQTSKEFIETNIRRTDVIIFTGSFKNIELCLADLEDQMVPLPIVFYNGSGYNPAVIGPLPPAQLPGVVKKLASARLLNGGQDCGAPDAILVHESHLDQFLAELQKRLDQEAESFCLETKGAYKTAKNFVTRGLASGRIVRGHCGSRSLRQVHPVISKRSIEDFATGSSTHLPADRLFEEFYAPIFNIISYQDDHQLAIYFEAQDYQDKSMYVSLFGSSHYIRQNIPGDVLLENLTVPDWDQAFKAYGGFGREASSIFRRGRKRDQPINLCRDLPFARLREGAKREYEVQPRARHNMISGQFNRIMDEVAHQAGEKAVASAFYYGQVNENGKFVDPYAQVRCLVVARRDCESAVDKSLQRVTAKYFCGAPPDMIWAPMPADLCARDDARVPAELASIPEAGPDAWHRENTMNFGAEPRSGLAAAIARAGQLLIRQAAPLIEVVRLDRYNTICFQSSGFLQRMTSDEDRAIAAALAGNRKDRVYWKNRPGPLLS